MLWIDDPPEEPPSEDEIRKKRWMKVLQIFLICMGLLSTYVFFRGMKLTKVDFIIISIFIVIPILATLIQGTGLLLLLSRVVQPREYADHTSRSCLKIVVLLSIVTVLIYLLVSYLIFSSF